MSVLADAQGVISKSKENLANALADAPTFRDMVNALTYEMARQSVYFGAPPPPANGETYELDEVRELRPWAIIDRSNGRLRREGTAILNGGGRIDVHIEVTVSDEDDEDPSALYRDFENKCGLIAEELFELGWLRSAPNFDATRTYISANEIEWEGPFREAPEDNAGEDRYAWMVLTIAWGPGGDA